MSEEALQGASIGIKLKDGTVTTFILDPTPDIVFKGNLSDSIKEQWNNFIIKIKELQKESKLPENIRVPESNIDVSFTRKELNKYQKAYFKFQCLIGNKEFLEFVEENPKSVKNLLNEQLLNKRILENSEVIKTLLKAGANPNAKDINDIPVISKAIDEKYTDTVIALLEAGADFDRETISALKNASEDVKSRASKIFAKTDIQDVELSEELVKFFLSNNKSNDMFDWIEKLLKTANDDFNKAIMNSCYNFFIHKFSKKHDNKVFDILKNYLIKIHDNNNIELGKHLIKSFVNHYSIYDAYYVHDQKKISNNFIRSLVLEQDEKGKYFLFKPAFTVFKDYSYIWEGIDSETLQKYIDSGVLKDRAILKIAIQEIIKGDLGVDHLKLLEEKGLDINDIDGAQCKNDPVLTVVMSSLQRSDSCNTEYIKFFLDRGMSPCDTKSCEGNSVDWVKNWSNLPSCGDKVLEVIKEYNNGN